MNLRWLTIALRFAGLILVVTAAVIFLSGDLSFRSETQTSADAYQIRHTVIFGHNAIIPGALGLVLFTASLFIRGKRV